MIGDRVQLAQALLNLIANAMDAVAAVEPPHRVVTITTESAYEAALVVVHDTGHGVGEEPEALFEPFFTTKPSGMGMGLPIVADNRRSPRGPCVGSQRGRWRRVSVCLVAARGAGLR